MTTTPLPATGPLPDVSTRPLSEVIRAFASALRQSPDQAWRTQLMTLIEPLRDSFTEHRNATEGDRGIYAGVVHDVPRLARTVDDLVAEHGRLDTAMAWLARAADRADATALRQEAIKVLGDLDRHRQHDADLIHEAYSTDIGGE